MAMVERADQRVDLLARLLGETVVKRIYIKLHALILSHGDTKWMKLPSGWIQVDPASWRTRETMTCRIGLGHMSRPQKLASARIIVADHDKLVEGGAVADLEKGKVGLVTAKHIYNGRKLLLEGLGETDVERYYQNPDKIQKQPQQAPPDTNLLMIQSNERIEQGKRQVDIMKLRAQQQADAIANQVKYALEERKFRFEQMEAVYERRLEELSAQLDQTSAADKAEVERLNLELATVSKELETAQASEKMDVERFKAQLSADTQVLLKQMDLGQEQLPVVENLSAAQEAIAQNQQSVNAALANLSSLIAEMRQPKEIAYDDAGEIVGVRNPLTGDVRPLRRGPGGEPLGLA